MRNFTDALRQQELDLMQFEKNRFSGVVSACYAPFNLALTKFTECGMQAQIPIVENILDTIRSLSAKLDISSSVSEGKSSNQTSSALPSTLHEFIQFILGEVKQLYGCQITTASLSIPEDTLLLDRLVREIIKFKFKPPISLNVSDCDSFNLVTQLESEQSGCFDTLLSMPNVSHTSMIEFIRLKTQWFELNKTITLLHALSVIEANTLKAKTVADTLLAKDHNSAIWQNFCDHFDLNDDHLLTVINRFTTKTISFPNLLHLFIKSDRLLKKFPLFHHQAVKAKTSRNQLDGLFYLHHQHELGQVLGTTSDDSKTPEGKSMAPYSKDFFNCIIPKLYSDHLKAKHTILIDDIPQNFYTILSDAFNQRCTQLNANSSISTDERRYSFGLLIKEFESHVLWFMSKAYLLDKVSEKIKPLQSCKNRPLQDIITKQLLIKLRQELEIRCSCLTVYAGDNIHECETQLSISLDHARELVTAAAQSSTLPPGFTKILRIAAAQESQLIVLLNWAENQSKKKKLTTNKIKQEKYHLILTNIEAFTCLLTKLCAELFELQYSEPKVAAIQAEIDLAYTTFIETITHPHVSPKGTKIPRDIRYAISKLQKKLGVHLPKEYSISKQCRKSMVSSLDIAKWQTSQTSSTHTVEAAVEKKIAQKTQSNISLKKVAEANIAGSKNDEELERSTTEHHSSQENQLTGPNNQDLASLSPVVKAPSKSTQKLPAPPLPPPLPAPPQLAPVSNQSASIMKPEVAPRKQTTESKTSASQSSLLEDIRRRRNKGTTFGLKKSAERPPNQQSYSTSALAQTVETQASSVAARPKPSFLNDIANLGNAKKVKINPSQSLVQENSARPALSFLEQIRDINAITLNHRVPEPQKTPDISNPLLKMMQRRLAVAGHHMESESDHSQSRSDDNESGSDWDSATDDQGCTTTSVVKLKK